MNLLQIESYGTTQAFWDAVNQQFVNGVEVVYLANQSTVVGTILSAAASKEMLARRVAERWLAEPAILDELAAKLTEEPEPWN